MARPPVLDPPRRVRRPRLLSAEERALWDGVARSARPLRPPRKVRAPEPAPDDPAAPPAPPAAAPVMRAPAGAKTGSKTGINAPPLAALARRERARIVRGRVVIEARIDLHGLTLRRAHAVLLRFLARAQSEGLTLVLVITGKGGRDGNGAGALRREVPEWLALAEFRGLVIGFEEAHAAHGGGGALYVRVRRPR